MTDTLKILGTATLTTTSASVYKPAALTSAIVSSFRLVNKGVAAATCYVMVGASSINVVPPGLSLSTGYAYVDSDPITLGTSESISAYASSASSIDMSVFGIEHTT